MRAWSKFVCASAALIGILLLVVEGADAAPYSGSGDWVINDVANSYAGGLITVYGNVSIEDGGRLELDGTTLVIDSPSDGAYGIHVKPGGTLILTNGATIKAQNGGMRYTFIVEGNFTSLDSIVQNVYGTGGTVPSGGIGAMPYSNVTIMGTTITNCGVGMMIKENSNTNLCNSNFTYNEIGLIVCKGATQTYYSELFFEGNALGLSSDENISLNDCVFNGGTTMIMVRGNSIVKGYECIVDPNMISTDSVSTKYEGYWYVHLTVILEGTLTPIENAEVIFHDRYGAHYPSVFTNSLGQVDVPYMAYSKCLTLPPNMYSPYNITVTYNGTENYTITPSTGNFVATVELVQNTLPVAIISQGTFDIDEDAIATFDSLSYDPDGDIVSAMWNFNDPYATAMDPSVKFGAHVTHAFSIEGNYTINLTVVDNLNGVTSITSWINVWNVAPSVSLSLQMDANEDENVSFACNAIDTPSDLANITISWQFFDPYCTLDNPEFVNTTGEASNAFHTFTHSGVYTIYVTVTDWHGASFTDIWTINITNLAPNADAGSDIFTAEDSVCTFDGSLSNDTATDMLNLNYTWNFHDPYAAPEDNIGYGMNPTHVYHVAGTYIVDLTVSDGELTDSANVVVYVSNVVPSLLLMSPAGGDEDANLAFFAEGFDTLSDISTLQISWQFVDPYCTIDNPEWINTTGDLSNAFHTFTHSGTYAVFVTVTDIHGNYTTLSTNVVINNVAPSVEAGSDIWVTLGGSVTLSAIATDTPTDLAEMNYLWDFGDMTSLPSQTAGHTYITEGIYIATITVTDDDGASAQDTLVVHVQLTSPEPMKPVANMHSNRTLAYTLETFYFDASSSYDVDGSIVSYNISFGDGTYYEGVSASTTHVYSDEGVFAVVLTIYDDDGMSDTYSVDVIVLNRLPYSTMSVISDPAPMDTMLFFQSVGASDADGVIANYEWNFGDQYSNPANPNVIIGAFFSSSQHSFVYPGVYNVTLKVYDDDGAYCTVVRQVTINNVVPTISLVPAFSGNEDSLITFSAIVDDTVSDKPFLTCIWDFDYAGTFNCDAVGTTVQHAYPSAGTYQAALVVFDTHGAMAVAYTTVTVYNVAPVASFMTASQAVTMGSSVWFGSTSYDTPSDMKTLNYTWDFNTSDSTFADAYGQSVYWTFQDNLTYSISLTVTDNNGATDVEMLDIYSGNVPPTAFAGDEVELPMDSEVVLCGYATDTAFDLPTLFYQWDFADANSTPSDNIVNALNASHVYTYPGNYLVFFNVTDQHGAVASSSTWVNVTNVAPIARAGASLSEFSMVEFYVDASNSTDTPSDMATLQYEWDFDGDGIPDATTCAAAYTYSSAGTYVVTLKVTDQHGAYSIDDITVFVDDPFPLIARFTVSATEAYTGVTINVDATSSTGTITSYDWTFGDSTSANGATSSHSYSTATTANGGWYEINLTITDGVRYDYCSAWVHILNQGPIAYAGTDISTTMDTPVTFSSAAISDQDPTPGTLTFEWDFGDPFDTAKETTLINPTHVYTVPGVYYATLRVTDDFGNTSTSTVTVTVTNYPVSSFSIAPDSTPVFEDMTITFTSTCVDTPSDDVVFFWDFDDSDGLSYNACGDVVSTSYSTSGAKTITAWVFDKYGGCAQATTMVLILNRAPTIITSLSSVTPMTAFEDQSFFLYAVAEDNASDMPKLNYTWEILISGAPIYTFYSANVNFSLANAGVYTVRITVRDDNGMTDIEETTLTILNAAPVLQVFASQNAYVDRPVTLLAKATDNSSDLSSLVYLWDFGTDGSPDWSAPDAWGSSVSITYTIPGNYTVSVNVSDDDGAHVIGTIWVNVINMPPFASINNAHIVVEDDLMSFSAAGSFDSSNDTPWLVYSWDFDASDGITTDDTGMTVVHSYTNVGIYIVTLTVTDPQGAFDTATSWVNVINGIPIARAGPDQTSNMDSSVSFDGTASSDTPSDIGTLNYTWDFGDTYAAPGDNIAYGALPTHTFTQPGTYTVTLTIADVHGATHSDTMQVVVNNIAPIANAGMSQSVNMDSVVTFDGSLSSDTVSDAALLNYTWDFGDAYAIPGDNVGYGLAPTHTYTHPGNYTATLVVTDPHGAMHSATVWTLVSNVAPVADAGPGQFVDMDAQVAFSGVLSTDTASDVAYLNYTWDFGDPNATVAENVGYGATPSHTYTHPGNYTATLVVTDQYGATSTAYVWTNVSNVLPTASPSAGVFSYEFNNVSFSVVSYNDSPSDIGTLNFYWDFNDPYSNASNPNTMTGLLVWHVYTVSGNYSVELMVVDRHGDYYVSYTFANVTNLPPTCDAGLDVSMPEQSIVSLTGEGYDTPYDQPLLNYTWDFGDSTIGYGKTTSHEYADVGTYTVTLTVRDTAGLTYSDTLTVTITNVAPIANAGMDLQTYEGMPVMITGSATDTPNDLASLSYFWDMNALDGISVDATGMNVGWIYNLSGNYTVTLTVTDHHGMTSTSTMHVLVINLPPTANAGSPQVVYEDAVVNFNGSLSTDTPCDMPSLSYSWDFNATDGITTQATGILSSYVFTDIGVYLVTLTVTDNDGVISQSTVTITVQNVPPVASAGADISIAEDSLASFSGVMSTDSPSDATTLNYTWDFGDASALAYGATSSHSYATTGTFTVTLTVRDIHGATSTDTLTVTVTNVVPTCSAGAPITANEDETIMLLGTGSDTASDIGALAFSWAFGDGTPSSSGAAVAHVYTQSGTYTATLTVTDAHGATATSNVLITVVNLPPTANAGTDMMVEVGVNAVFTATANDTPSDIGSLVYSWDFDASNGIGEDATGITVTHAYTQTGTYTVTLRVTDNNGAFAIDTLTVLVGITPPTCDAGSDMTIMQGGTAHFMATANDTASHLPSLNYTWDFDLADGLSAEAYGASVEHTYALTGTYVVTLVVTDDDGSSTTDTLTVTVQNVAPTCDAGADMTIAQFQIAHFLGTGTDTQIDLPTLTYSWDFDASDGIGIDATGVASEHNYTVAGTYIVTLTVRDIHGAFATDTLTVNVTPVYTLPVVEAGTDIAIEQGAQVTLAAIIISSQYALDDSWFTWMSNGALIGTGKVVNTTSFVDVGVFTVTLTIALPGSNTLTDSLQITVSNVLPTCSFECPAYVQKGASTGDISATASDITADVGTLQYSWTFGDETANVTTKTVSHVYMHSGTYNITLVVTDRFGGTAKCIRTIIVNNSAPTVSGMSFNKDIMLGTMASFTLDGISDADGEIVSIVWDFGDGSAKATGGKELTSISHSYKSTGEYVVTVVITDDEGKALSLTDKVTVKADSNMPWILFAALLGMIFIVGFLASRKKAKLIEDMPTETEEKIVEKKEEKVEPESLAAMKMVQPQLSKPMPPPIQDAMPKPMPPPPQPPAQQAQVSAPAETLPTMPSEPAKITETKAPEIAPPVLPPPPAPKPQIIVSDKPAEVPSDEPPADDDEGSMLSALLPPGASMPKEDEEQ